MTYGIFRCKSIFILWVFRFVPLIKPEAYDWIGKCGGFFLGGGGAGLRVEANFACGLENGGSCRRGREGVKVGACFCQNRKNQEKLC